MRRVALGRPGAAGLIAVLVVIVCGGADAGAAGSGRTAIDLRAEANVRIVSPPRFADDPETWVWGGGDINGDGRPDLVVEATASEGIAFASYVVFTRPAARSVKLASLGEHGFRVGDAYALAVGDVNRDGRGDLLVRGRDGRLHLVFGKADSSPVNVDRLGAGGFLFIGASSGTPAGDVNGDGYADLMVFRARDDSSYIVFGRPSAAAVDVAALGDRGFRIDVPAREHGGGGSGVGDVNGDGRDDMLIETTSEEDADGYVAGRSFVVFGRDSSGTVTLSNLGAQGFEIVGERVAGWFAGVGDVNGDGLADIAVGDFDDNGDSYGFHVVLGARSGDPVDVRAPGSRGYRIQAPRDHEVGDSIDGAGDVNRDGLADIIVGAPGASYNRRPQSGSAYVVYGRRSTAAINIRNIGARGFRIDGAVRRPRGEEHGARAGKQVAGVGDINGDGRADLGIGSETRTAYLVFAGARPPTCRVPNVVGKRLTAARRALTTVRCSVGRVRRAYSARVPKGRVAEQKPRPGIVLPDRSRVGLVVSRGRKR